MHQGYWCKFSIDEKDADCIKISASADTNYKPNFCYKDKITFSDVAEVGVGITQVAGGVIAAALATPETLGSAAIPAYCGTSLAISAAGGWVLAGVKSNDKWPNGLVVPSII